MGQSFPTMLASLHVRWAFNGNSVVISAAGVVWEEHVAGNDLFFQDMYDMYVYIYIYKYIYLYIYIYIYK